MATPVGNETLRAEGTDELGAEDDARFSEPHHGGAVCDQVQDGHAFTQARECCCESTLGRWLEEDDLRAVRERQEAAAGAHGRVAGKVSGRMVAGRTKRLGELTFGPIQFDGRIAGNDAIREDDVAEAFQRGPMGPAARQAFVRDDGRLPPCSVKAPRPARVSARSDGPRQSTPARPGSTGSSPIGGLTNRAMRCQPRPRLSA